VTGTETPGKSATENVFLDTEAFVDAGYNYESKRLATLRELAKQDRVHVFITDITLREIRAGLHDAIDQAAAAKPPTILRNSRLPEVRNRVTGLDPVALEEELAAQLAAFIDACGMTILAVGNECLPAVLDKYFDRRPPFGAGKNKAEFPDALSIEALLAWCFANEAAMAVVSRDAGVRTCCSESGPLRGFETLSAFLDAVASEDKALSSFVRDSLEHISDDIDAAVLGALEEVSFHWLDENGEVERVEDAEVEWLDSAEIISLTPALVTIEFPARFIVTAVGSHFDSGSAAYDSEDGIYMFQDVVDDSLRRGFDRRVAVDIEIRGQDLRVLSAEILDSPLIGLRVYEPDPWE
jgi:PIN domain